MTGATPSGWSSLSTPGKSPNDGNLLSDEELTRRVEAKLQEIQNARAQGEPLDVLTPDQAAQRLSELAARAKKISDAEVKAAQAALDLHNATDEVSRTEAAKRMVQAANAIDLARAEGRAEQLKSAEPDRTTEQQAVQALKDRLQSITGDNVRKNAVADVVRQELERINNGENPLSPEEIDQQIAQRDAEMRWDNRNALRANQPVALDTAARDRADRVLSEAQARVDLEQTQAQLADQEVARLQAAQQNISSDGLLNRTVDSEQAKSDELQSRINKLQNLLNATSRGNDIVQLADVQARLKEINSILASPSKLAQEAANQMNQVARRLGAQPTREDIAVTADRLQAEYELKAKQIQATLNGQPMLTGDALTKAIAARSLQISLERGVLEGQRTIPRGQTVDDVRAQVTNLRTEAVTGGRTQEFDKVQTDINKVLDETPQEARERRQKTLDAATPGQNITMESLIATEMSQFSELIEQAGRIARGDPVLDEAAFDAAVQSHVGDFLSSIRLRPLDLPVGMESFSQRMTIELDLADQMAAKARLELGLGDAMDAGLDAVREIEVKIEAARDASYKAQGIETNKELAEQLKDLQAAIEASKGKTVEFDGKPMSQTEAKDLEAALKRVIELNEKSDDPD